MFNSVKGEHGSALTSRGVIKKHLFLIVSFLLLGNLSALVIDFVPVWLLLISK